MTIQPRAGTSLLYGVKSLEAGTIPDAFLRQYGEALCQFQ